MKTPSTSTILHLAGKMKRPTIPMMFCAKRRIRSLTSSVRFSAIFVLIVAAAFYTATSASSSRNRSRNSLPSSVASPNARSSSKSVLSRNNKKTELSDQAREHETRFIKAGAFFPLLLPQAAPPAESIATFAGNCSTPKTEFNLGETVCAKISNAPIRTPAALRHFSWSAVKGNVRQTEDVTANPDTNLFVIPASNTSVIDGETVDNRGTWAVSSNATDNGTRAIAYFTVKDPAHAAADLLIYNASSDSGEILTPGSSTSFVLWVGNKGPDPATDVHVTQATPPFMTFDSASQSVGTGFTCTHTAGVTSCSSSSLPSGEVVALTVNYTIDSNAPNAIITSQADVVSDTEDPVSTNNSSEAQIEVRSANGQPATCSINCPSNIIATANATENGQSGAYVNFSTEATGGPAGCGTVTASTPSGSFFPVGSTSVTVTSSIGGGACSFTVTVVDEAPVTISCQANITATAANGECNATVNIVEPTATGNGVTVSGQRSDNQALNASYPAGTTTITWTATDADGNQATCQQTVTVNVNDTTAPTVTAPPDVNIATPPGASGACGLVIGETELGTPTTSDDCGISISRTGVPAGSFFPLGTTTITYTATDAAGNVSAPATQTVTVTDGTPPLIAAPADESYVCPSEVPAADVSQATRGDVFDQNNHLLPPGPPSDNCSAVTVTVSETSSGAGSASSPLIILRTFTATDTAGNSASSVQTITVIDNIAPSITLNGDSSITIECHASFTDPGASSSPDNCAGSAPVVTTNGSVNVDAPGTYTLEYTATDAAGNSSAPVTRTVTVVDTAPPTLTLNGASPMAVECHTGFSDPGATASDACAGDLTGSIVVTGSVDPNTVGSYTLTYTVNDGQGHSVSATRAVEVVDTTAPTIALNGDSPMTVECHTSFSDPGATASDGCAGDLTSAISSSGAVNVNVPGTYTRTYTVSDGHNTTTVTRTVNVVDTIAPVINLNGQNISFWPANHSYKTVNVTDLVASVTDSCDTGIALSSVVIQKVTSDEVENGNGDGNTLNDIVIAANCKSVQLRAERDGSGNGRVYTITFRVKDASGNVGTKTAQVKVPKNANGGAVDSGVQYTVNGNCP